MGNTNVPKAVSKFLYGIELITCHVCGQEPVEPGGIEYNCHQCNDMGEFWAVPTKNGTRWVQVGKLYSALQTLAAEQLMNAIDNAEESR